MLKKRIFIFFKIFIYFAVDTLAQILFLLTLKKTKSVDEILIVGHHQLGDFILSLDSLKEYKKTFSGTKIVLLCNENLFDLAQKTNYFDEIIVINVKKLFFGVNILSLDFSFKNFKYRFQKILELKQKKYKKIINSQNLFYISMLVKSLNSDEKIGVFDQNKYLGNLFNLPYTKLIKLDLKHELIDLAAFFRQVSGFKNFAAGLPKFEFEIPKYKFLDTTNYCVLSLGGSFYEKTWDVENFVKTFEQVLLDFKIDIVLVGLKSEQKFASKFLDLYRGKNIVIDLVGKTDLLEYISVVKGAKFVFGNDSGVIHLAVATQVKSVCITSGHSYEYCVPYIVEKMLTQDEQKILPISVFEKMDCFGCGLICNKKLSKAGKFQCVENIGVSDAVFALNKILSDVKN